MYKWYGKGCAAGITPFGQMIQEEALKIQKSVEWRLIRKFYSV